MAELTVASTTDTQKDIVLAAGGTPEPEAKSEVSNEKPERQEVETQLPPKPSKSAAQRRFDALTREINQLKNQLASRPQAAEAKAEPQPQPEVAEPALPARPTQNDVDPQTGQPKFATYEEYEEALLDWKLDIRQAKEAEKARQEAEAKRVQEIEEAYSSQVDAAKAKYEDFEQALSGNIPMWDGVIVAIKQLENGAEVAYYLGKNRDIAKKLMEMTPVRAIAEVGKIAASLGERLADTPDTGEENEAIEEDEEQPVHKADPPPRQAVSAAPRPIKPVGGSATKSSVPLDELPYAEYRKLRDQQARNRYRR